MSSTAAASQKSKQMRLLSTALATSLAVMASGQASATGTRAGTLIDNTASATYDPGSGPQTITSNVAQVRVDELLNVVVDNNGVDVPTTPGATNVPVLFEVTNTGNGVESFRLGVVPNGAGDNFDPTSVQIILDDGDGVYEPGIDTPYIAGTNDPVLNPDQIQKVFVIGTIPGTVTNGDRALVKLTADAVTGTGAPGTTFTGAGEGGGDAVVGTTGAKDFADGYYAVQAATIALNKSAVVVGGDAIPGAIITYTITATTSGSASLAGVSINDTVPANTTYVPGSLTLGGAPLTDAADTDAGVFASNAIAVSLGTVPAGTTRTVTFQVRIN